MQRWTHKQQHEEVELQRGETVKKKLSWIGLGSVFLSTVVGPAPASQSALLIPRHHMGQKLVWGENQTNRNSLLFFHIHDYIKPQFLLPTAGSAEELKIEPLQSVLSGWGKTVKGGN